MLSNPVSWQKLRLCPMCGFHKYRLTRTEGGGVDMTCDGCGHIRKMPCPKCGIVGAQYVEPKTYIDGRTIDRAYCSECGHTCTEWNVKSGTARKRKSSLRKYVMDRDAACALCGSVGVAQVHHVEQFACGGADTMANLVRLCEACHQAQHRRSR